MNAGFEQVAIRLPYGMRDQLKAVAKSANRSVNAQLITILKDVLGSASVGQGVEANPADAGSEAAAQ